MLIVPDPEWTALEAGLKPAVRIAVRPADAPRLAAGLRSRGAAVVLAPRRIRFGRREPESIVYVARSIAAAEQLRDAEGLTLESENVSSDVRTQAHRDLGRLLGYPPCCVESYLVVSAVFDDPAGARQATIEDVLHARAALAATTTYAHARVNPLLIRSRLRLVTFYPCRYDCTLAIEYADALYNAMARKDAGATEALDRALACTVALSPDGARAVVTVGPDGAHHAEAPPRPTGMVDERGDGRFALGLERSFAKGAVPDDVLMIRFRHRQ